ncbi:MAG: flagellar export chaperone FliS [Erysipelotrichaceae bacterium]
MNNPYATYQQNSINTMTPGEMVVALYDGAIKQVNLAITHIEGRDAQAAHTSLIKAQEIILYLKQTLNFEVDMSNQLGALYDFYLEQLLQANMKKETKPLQDILPMLVEMKQTFAQADRLTRMKETR